MRHDFEGLWWIWPLVISTVLLSPRSQCVVALVFEGGREAMLLSGLLSQTLPGLLSYYRHRVAALWCLRCEQRGGRFPRAFEPGIARIRPSQCGAGRCWGSPEGGVGVPLCCGEPGAAITAAAAPAVCNVAWLCSRGGRAPSPGRPGWWTQTRSAPSCWSWNAPLASTQRRKRDQRLRDGQTFADVF